MTLEINFRFISTKLLNCIFHWSSTPSVDQLGLAIDYFTEFSWFLHLDLLVFSPDFLCEVVKLPYQLMSKAALRHHSLQ